MKELFLVLKDKIKLLCQSEKLVNASSIISLLDEIKYSDLTPQDKMSLINFSCDTPVDSLINLVFISHNMNVINSFYNFLVWFNKQGISYDIILEKMFFKKSERMLNPLALAKNKDELYVYLCILKNIYSYCSDGNTRDFLRNYLLFPSIDISGSKCSLVDFILRSGEPSFVYALIDLDVLKEQDYLLFEKEVDTICCFLEKSVELSRDKYVIGRLIITILSNPGNPFHVLFSLSQPNNPILTRLNGVISKLDMERELAIACAAFHLDVDDSIGADSCVSTECDSEDPFESDSNTEEDQQENDVAIPLLHEVSTPAKKEPVKTVWNRVHNGLIGLFTPSPEKRSQNVKANFDYEKLSPNKEDDQCLPFHDRL